ncbi:UNVERIFIED_CONTAM: hypothetical protein Sradi_2532000 [Sesamum radiatum]|uniref:Uncharacterized protein n=1 Tax=Sesamum radiatum TaxID=300843 RepID=A0AAW2SKW2_SESRA
METPSGKQNKSNDGGVVRGTQTLQVIPGDPLAPDSRMALPGASKPLNPTVDPSHRSTSSNTSSGERSPALRDNPTNDCRCHS